VGYVRLPKEFALRPTGVYFFLSWYATGLLATAMNN